MLTGSRCRRNPLVIASQVNIGVAFEDLTKNLARRYQVNPWTEFRLFRGWFCHRAQRGLLLRGQPGGNGERVITMVKKRSASRRPEPLLVDLTVLPGFGGLPAVLDVPLAGRLLGIGRTRSYRLAAAGEFPCRVLRVGGTWRVPTADLLEVLGITVPAPVAPPSSASVSVLGTRAARRARGRLVTW